MPRTLDDGEWSFDALVEFLADSEDAVSLTDANGVFLYANKAGAAAVGHTPEELIGLRVQDVGRGTMHDFQRVAIDAAAVNRIEVTARNCRLPDGEGRLHVVDITMTPVPTDRGTVVAVGIKEPPDKYAQTRLFRGLLESAPDAMVIVDRSGRIVLVNAQTERMFGYSRAELIDQAIEILVPRRFAEEHRGLRDGYTSDPRVRPMGLLGDLNGRRRDGTEFPIEVSLSPLETEDGLLVSAAVRDISERRRVQAAPDRAKDEFFATVSHELRTPLASMVGYSELMGDLEELSPQGERFLSVIRRNALRELRLVDDLLTLAAIGERGLSIRAKPLDLEALAREAVESARPRAEEAGLHLAVSTPGYAVPLSGDRDRLGQALDNLLSNALKFTPRGGRVQVEVRESGGQVEVEVTDTGPGIGDLDPALLFGRLYRSSDAVAAQVPGAGLGLTIALAMVEAHGGTITVPRSDGTGSVFRITLPVPAPPQK